VIVDIKSMLKGFIKRFVRQRPTESEWLLKNTWEGVALVECSNSTDSGLEKKYYFTVLPSDQMFNGGLLPEAIVGEYLESPSKNGNIEPEKFAANTVFKDFLHAVIAKCGDLPDVAIEARRIGQGLVTVIDRRVPDVNAAIKPTDILGGFTVENGVVTGYSRNPNHVLLNQYGFFVLDTNIQSRLLNALEALEKNRGEVRSSTK